MLQTPSLGFVLGVDIYDCILVINTFTVLEIFARQKFTLGTDVSLTTGPVVSLGLLENDVRCADLSDTVVAYVKAKGQLSEIKLDGTLLSERADENERFYGMKIGVPKILAGDINQSLPQTRPLSEMLKAAEGRTDYDTALVEQLSAQPAPGDATIESPTTANGTVHTFGVPDVDDPDPFGVVALEMAGMEIREAGTRLRPESSQFDYNPSPSSPLFPRLSRRSVDTYISRSNRGSYMSNKTIATERSQVTDAGTQTFTSTPETTPSQSEDGNPRQPNDDAPEVREPEEVDYTKIDLSALRKLSNFPDLEEEPTETIAMTEEKDVNKKETNSAKEPESKPEGKTESENKRENTGASPADNTEPVPIKGRNDSLDKGNAADNNDDDEDEDDEDDFEDAEEAVVFEVVTAQTPQRMAMRASQGVQVKGSVVTIPRRVPPPLPARSPARASRQKSQMIGEGMVSSPLRQEFDLRPGDEELLTPRPQDAQTMQLEENSGSATMVQTNEPPTSEQEVKVVQQPPTPVAESQDSVSPSPKIEERSPKHDSVVPRRSSSAEEQPNPTSSHAVPLSVS
ncbi:hypothetical protein DL766_002827 [Monosporascus sp. MC13-8B]|uniref:Ysc84 actin-binding domain-containing protein n=1 Tax=Monosporascus cannonballus TaxID=155416 RepID=A0ABY0H648_9PEZI|nr:hypothetical protein DL762_006495 [Monosporascus cannonballus]RYO88192.1 hypothetical protein DL763_006097 [Monosporascus cannonballus]RYP34837.1 hypothetical protein DL766_002827 [Monosporascus sp. MC13-8B]